MSQHKTIAPRTRKQLEDAIKPALKEMGIILGELNMGDLLDAIDAGFVVKRRQELDAIKYASPAPGQVWRNRKSSRLVRIDNIHSGDIYWSNIDGTPGPKSGEIWRRAFLQKYEYVPERMAGK